MSNSRELLFCFDVLFRVFAKISFFLLARVRLTAASRGKVADATDEMQINTMLIELFF